MKFLKYGVVLLILNFFVVTNVFSQNRNLDVEGTNQSQRKIKNLQLTTKYSFLEAGANVRFKTTN